MSVAKKIGIGVLSVIVVALVVVGVYLADYSKADDVAMSIYEENNKSLEFVGDNTDYGFIIYPGGKVDEIAYVRTAKLLSDQGYNTIVAKFPLNIGFTNINAADDIIEKYDNVEKWVIIGHSLGGVTASVYASDDTNENVNKVAGLVFEGSYSTEDLKNTGIDVLLLRASNDKVLNLDGYNENLSNYDKEHNNLLEFVIDGGNHAGFGNYGLQDGDGENTIGYEEQQQIVVDKVLEFVGNIE